MRSKRRGRISTTRQATSSYSQDVLLETRRLLLRPVLDSELDLLYGHWSVPEVGRWLWDDEIPTREQIGTEVAKSRETFSSSGYGIWGVFRRDGTFVGTCGLLVVPEGTDEVEILFSIEPREWRRGYAAEAAAEVLRYGLEDVGLDTVVGRCDVPNEPSRRLLEKLGMVFEKRAPIEGVDCYHYRLRR